MDARFRMRKNQGRTWLDAKNEMTRFVKGLPCILVVLLASASLNVQAAQVEKTPREGEAVVTKLNANASAITYWVSKRDGWHVVTTIDIVIGPGDDAEKHAVVRFSSVLLPGQSQLISVPFVIGEPQQVLHIRRLGDQIKIVCGPGSHE